MNFGGWRFSWRLRKWSGSPSVSSEVCFFHKYLNLLLDYCNQSCWASWRWRRTKRDWTQPWRRCRSWICDLWQRYLCKFCDCDVAECGRGMGGSCSQNSASAGRGLHQTHAWLASSKRVHDGGETTCNCNNYLNFRAKNVSSKAARREAEGKPSEASLNYFYIVNFWTSSSMKWKGENPDTIRFVNRIPW